MVAVPQLRTKRGTAFMYPGIASGNTTPIYPSYQSRSRMEPGPEYRVPGGRHCGYVGNRLSGKSGLPGEIQGCFGVGALLGSAALVVVNNPASSRRPAPEHRLALSHWAATLHPDYGLCAGAQQGEEDSVPLHADWEASRHLTALVRYGFSAPVQSLARYGFLDGHHTLFDYRCGRGDDLRGLAENGLTVSTHFISPDFLEFNRAASPALLHRRCSILQGPAIRVKHADFLDWRGAGSRGEMRGAERPLSDRSGPSLPVCLTTAPYG